MATQQMSSLETYMTAIKNSVNGPDANGNVPMDGSRLSFETLTDIAKVVNDKVENFLMTEYNGLIVKRGEKEEFTNVLENTSFESLMSACGGDKLVGLVRACKIPENYVRACCEDIAIELNRASVGSREKNGAWRRQIAKADHSSNGSQVRSLTDFYPSEFVSNLSNFTPGQEAFGPTIDAVVPDMKITMTTAIMNFHARIMPRLVPTRTTDQNNVTITKEYLEVYDNTDVEGKSSRLVDLYDNPSLADNELQLIVPREANDVDDKGARTNLVVKDGILAFNETANILKLSLDASKPGHEHVNRTDLIEENVRYLYTYVALTAGGKTEVFQIAANESFNQLTRLTNSRDSADRAAINLLTRVKLYKNAKIATNDISGDWKVQSSTILEAMPPTEYI